MLDSFDIDTDSENKSGSGNNNGFDANTHMLSLCEGSRLKIRNYREFDYKKGWAQVIADLILEIRKYPIELQSMLTDFGHLMVFFECYEKTQEVKVWRAIHKAQNICRSTCMHCGSSGLRRIHDEKLVVICIPCFRKSEDNVETGTWLDKFQFSPEYCLPELL